MWYLGHCKSLLTDLTMSATQEGSLKATARMILCKHYAKLSVAPYFTEDEFQSSYCGFQGHPRSLPPQSLISSSTFFPWLAPSQPQWDPLVFLRCPPGILLSQPLPGQPSPPDTQLACFHASLQSLHHAQETISDYIKSHLPYLSASLGSAYFSL